MEQRAKEIWHNNLREFCDIMHLDSIVIKSMIEFAKEQQKGKNYEDISDSHNTKNRSHSEGS